jgi:hypothetical protein
MIGRDVTSKVLGGAASALELAVGVARHVAWYVTYQVDGKAREAEAKRRKS